MAYRAAVVGASGYTGAEALRLLAGHPEIEVVHVTAASNAGVRLADLYPALLPAYGDAVRGALEEIFVGSLAPGARVFGESGRSGSKQAEKQGNQDH